jgi:periplasmic protein TonB
MFNKLVASEGRQKSFWSPSTIIASVLIHVVMVGAAVAAGVGHEPGERSTEEYVEFIDLDQAEADMEPEPEPEEPEAPPPPPEPQAAPPVARGFQELVPPTEPPTRIPDVDPSQIAVSAEDFTGVGQRGGVATGVDGGVAQDVSRRETPADQGTYELHAVEEHPAVSNQRDFARQVERNYPPLLRDAGVQGTVHVRMRVLENGRVDTESIQIVSATHEQFGEATRRAVERLRFTPARVGGRPVRVWVEIPIQWTLAS